MKKYGMVQPTATNKVGGYKIESPVAKGANPLGSSRSTTEEEMIDGPAETPDETTSQVLRRDDDIDTNLYKVTKVKPKM